MSHAANIVAKLCVGIGEVRFTVNGLQNIL